MAYRGRAPISTFGIRKVIWEVILEGFEGACLSHFVVFVVRVWNPSCFESIVVRMVHFWPRREYKIYLCVSSILCKPLRQCFHLCVTKLHMCSRLACGVILMLWACVLVICMCEYAIFSISCGIRELGGGCCLCEGLWVVCKTLRANVVILEVWGAVLCIVGCFIPMSVRKGKFGAWGANVGQGRA